MIVDREGTVRAAVIDFGGFLGVGSRKIVVDWNALHFGRVANKSDSITLELTKEQVRAAPEYKEDAPVIVLGAAGSLQPVGIRPLEGEIVWSRAHPIRSTGLTTIAAGGRPAAAIVCRCRRCRRRRADTLARKASAASTGSSSFSPTCRPASVRSSRSI